MNFTLSKKEIFQITLGAQSIKQGIKTTLTDCQTSMFSENRTHYAGIKGLN
jgi:hypothetical protein